MSDRITELLTFLYGKSEAPELERRVHGLIEQHRPPEGVARPWASLPLTERDVLLITYGDQVREAGKPPLESLCGFLEEHARGLLSGVHLLPFFPYSSDDGFSVVDYYSVDPALGGWEDIARLAQGFDLMFDAVLNHVSAGSEWFRGFMQDDPAYRGYFLTVDGRPDLSAVVRPRALPLLTPFPTASGSKQVWTTFSADQVDLNYRNPEVLLRMLDVLLYYVARGARFLRLDAIAYLWKEIGTTCIHNAETHIIVRLIRAVLDRAAPGVLLITETNVPHRENLSYLGDGTNEAQLVYNFALPPLILHALQTGDASALSRWASTLKPLSKRTTLFNFTASHDGIGLNPVRGILQPAEIDRLVARTLKLGGLVSYTHNPNGSSSPYELNINYYDALEDPNNAGEDAARHVDRFMTSQAIMLSLAGIPGIYFHSLFGSRGDRSGAEASGIARRINRAKLARRDLERELAEAQSLRFQVFTRYAEMLSARRSCLAFHPLGDQEVLDCGAQVFGLIRESPGGQERALCLYNVGDAELVTALAGHEGERWLDMLGGDAYEPDPGGVLRVRLKPYGAAWLSRSE